MINFRLIFIVGLAVGAIIWEIFYFLFVALNFLIVWSFVYSPMQPENRSSLLNFTLPSNGDIFVEVWFGLYVPYIGIFLALVVLCMKISSEQFEILLRRFYVLTPFVVFPMMYCLILSIESIINWFLHVDLSIKITPNKRHVLSLVCLTAFLIILFSFELWQMMNRKLHAIAVFIGCLVMIPLAFSALCLAFPLSLMFGSLLSSFCLLIFQRFMDDHAKQELLFWTFSIVNLLTILHYVISILDMLSISKRKRPRVTLVLIVLIIITFTILMYYAIVAQENFLKWIFQHDLLEPPFAVSMDKKVCITISFSFTVIVLASLLSEGEYMETIIRLQNQTKNSETLENINVLVNNESDDVTELTNITIHEDLQTFKNENISDKVLLKHRAKLKSKMKLRVVEETEEYETTNLIIETEPSSSSQSNGQETEENETTNLITKTKPSSLIESHEANSNPFTLFCNSYQTRNLNTFVTHFKLFLKPNDFNFQLIPVNKNDTLTLRFEQTSSLGIKQNKTHTVQVKNIKHDQKHTFVADDIFAVSDIALECNGPGGLANRFSMHYVGESSMKRSIEITCCPQQTTVKNITGIKVTGKSQFTYTQGEHSSFLVKMD